MGASGLLDLIQLAAVLVFALPLALFGLQWLAEGRLLGLAFLAVAGLMLLLPHLVTNPLDPVDVAETAAGHVLGEDEEK